MRFVNEFSPFLFKIPGTEFGVRWYGLAYILGFVLAYLTLKRAVAEGRIPKMEPKHLEPLLYGIIAGVVGGGRLGYCVQHPARLLKDPLFLFKFNEGGMAFFGGLIGVILALVIFCKRTGVKFFDLGDVVALPTAAALGFGRIANFINAELWGIPTNANWGVIYPKVDQQLRHPSELYESATHFLLAGVLYVSARYLGLDKKSGWLTCLFVVGYGLLRVITEHFRTADRYVGVLTTGQVASLVIAAAGIVVWGLIVRRGSQSVTSDEN